MYDGDIQSVNDGYRRALETSEQSSMTPMAALRRQLHELDLGDRTPLLLGRDVALKLIGMIIDDLTRNVSWDDDLDQLRGQSKRLVAEMMALFLDLEQGRGDAMELLGRMREQSERYVDLLEGFNEKDREKLWLQSRRAS